MMMYVPLALIAAAYLVYWYITRTFNYWKDRNVVSSPPVPLFGNVKDIALRKKCLGCAYHEMYKQFPNEKVVGIYRMTTPSVLIRDLDILKHVFIKDFDLFASRGMELSSKGLGANLFHLNTEMWRVLRPRFSPMFTSGKLKNMFHLLIEKANKMSNFFEGDIGEQPEQDVVKVGKSFTISAIFACAFGIDVDLNDSRLEELRRVEKLVFEPNFLLEFDMMFPGALKMFNVDFFPSELTTFFDNLVKTVFEQRNGKPTNRKDFMDLILEMKQQKVIFSGKQSEKSELSVELSDSIIAAQAFVFYVAGFETSSTTLSFLLYELTQNLNIQNKLITEVDDVLKKTNGVITYDSLLEMPYLTKVFDETLRKYPIVDPLQRCALADYKLPGTDLTIKKGQIVFTSVLGIHHDEKYYPNPEVFDPERFSLENTRDRHPCAYLPFGIGPRNCIGMRFGKIQTLVFMVQLLSQYRVEASANTPKQIIFDPKRGILGSLGGLKMNIIKRF